jgi:hypothetical protein
MTRIAVVESAPIAETHLSFTSVTGIHEPEQKNVQGMGVVMTDIVARDSKWLESNRSAHWQNNRRRGSSC